MQITLLHDTQVVRKAPKHNKKHSKAAWKAAWKLVVALSFYTRIFLILSSKHTNLSQTHQCLSAALTETGGSFGLRRQIAVKITEECPKFQCHSRCRVSTTADWSHSPKKWGSIAETFDPGVNSDCTHSQLIRHEQVLLDILGIYYCGIYL